MEKNCYQPAVTLARCVAIACASLLCGTLGEAQTWGPPTFTPPPVSSTPPALPPSVPPSLGTPDFYSSAPFGSTTPSFTSPPSSFAAPPAQGFGTGVAPGFDTGPPTMFPGQVQPYGAPPPNPYYPEGMNSYSDYVKLIQNIRLRNTWLYGESDPSEFGINEFEVAITAAWPDFCFSQQPLLITPGFILDLWDPPAIPNNANVNGQIPANAYGAYLDFYWAPKVSPRFTAELDFRIGVYSDFDKATTDAIRPQGYGAGIWQATPTFALKGGATYINRVDIKILPVVGVIWTPNQHTYWDITFPNPKLSTFLTTCGSTDLWWYVAGEYGGGSWDITEVTNASGDSGRMDINDIRLILGLEWTGPTTGFKGFFEVGYVFQREIVFQVVPADFDPTDTIMLRGGIAF